MDHECLYQMSLQLQLFRYFNQTQKYQPPGGARGKVGTVEDIMKHQLGTMNICEKRKVRGSIQFTGYILWRPGIFVAIYPIAVEIVWCGTNRLDRLCIWAIPNKRISGFHWGKNIASFSLIKFKFSFKSSLDTFHCKPCIFK